MIFQFLFKGILIGFLASLPIGPISILIIQRTIKNSRIAGFYSGIGAALSDTIYATAAGFSLSVIIEFISINEMYFKIGGSLVLIILGIIIFLGSPEQKTEKINSKSTPPIKNLLATFLLTFTNPLVIFLHIGIFTAFRIILDATRPMQAILILSGFFLGAVFWWFILTGTLKLFRNRINTKIYQRSNKIAGATIVVIVFISLLVALIHNVGVIF